MDSVISTVLVILSVWAFGLAVSTARTIITVKREGSSARASDWWQLMCMMIVAAAAGIAPLCPAMITTYTSGLLGLSLATIVLLQHVSERQYHTTKRLNQRFKK